MAKAAGKKATGKKAAKASEGETSKAKAPQAGRGGAAVFGYAPTGVVEVGSGKERPAGLRGEALVVGAAGVPKLRQLLPDLPAWLVERALRRRGEPAVLVRAEGPLWLLIPNGQKRNNAHDGLLEPSAYGAARDVVGAMMGAALPDYQLAELGLHFLEAADDEILGGLVGAEMGSYRFRAARAGNRPATRVVAYGVKPELAARAGRLGGAVNLARHLVNLPAGDLDPKTFADAAVSLFKGSKSATVEVWDTGRVEKEGLGLLAATGRGAAEGPRLVRIRYRPKGGGRYERPLAFVGKGITFDTGGLDVKDAASMRLMKKDMGGAASVLGLAQWVEAAGLDVACDFYLALAENAISERSFHPGDVIAARSGLTVEIDNTDAEGRLVLADAFDVAVKQAGKEAPLALVDFATLTGAMRIALGTKIAGYFATDDALAAAVARAGQATGEPTWRMPLFPDYFAMLKSTVADFANSGGGRFGGAITAALFLQRFVGTVPWLHFDMYAWTEGPTAGCAEPGGSGQIVQLFAHLLETLPADAFG